MLCFLKTIWNIWTMSFAYDYTYVFAFIGLMNTLGAVCFIIAHMLLHSYLCLHF